ncbi:MAG: 3-oxoacyl-ACP reductase FabG [Clostridiales bacterium]|nr:3-oxoacyl-ACP reductase FabG [Candidatus Equinaster intestinalis]
MNDKKTVVVTGASKGIGADIAMFFAEKGYNVVIGYNNSAESALLLQNSLMENGYSVMAHKVNVSNMLEVELLMKEAIYHFGTVDILVNNAGVSYQGLLTETHEKDWDNLMNVNLKGVYNCCKAVLPEMIKNKSGKIINISSVWGISGASCEAAYSASKAGVIGLTKALAKEVGPSGITVNCIAPGMIDTKMNDHLSEEDKKAFTDSLPISRIGTTTEIAETVFFLASDAANYITGQTIAVDGGLTI